MNAPPPCDCCQPACCNACSPPCPQAPVGGIKLEPQNRKQPVCSVKNCAIFGTHDTNPPPEFPCPARRIKVIKDENLNSLGSPIGMVASNVTFKTEGKPSDIGQARFATNLKAFARLYLNAENTWTTFLLDDVMREGLQLYTTSEKEENKLESPPEIYTASEMNILREFEMGNCNFHVELMEKFKLNTSASAELGANGDSSAGEIMLDDLKPALKSFFRKHKYCLFSMGSVYFSIWRSEDVYFVLDVCGRRITDFQSDKDRGAPMLICLHTLENVRHLIANLSSLQSSTEPISIREMKIVKVTTPNGAVVQRDYGKRVHQYQVVNDDYAYLKAGLHLTLNKADLIRNRSALPVGVTAMVISKIDHPATWNTKMVDKILCFGVNFCQKCWVKCSATEAIDVTEFPRNFNMGQFLISTELIESKYEGTWRCVPGFKHSELAQAIEKAFEVGDQKLLVQINYQMYAIWKKHGFIYLLDPYRHRILGKDDDPETYEQMEKSATVRMFRSFEVFMNAFNHILLDSNRTNKYKIHVLRVVNIQKIKMRDGQAIVPVEEAKLGIDGEVLSINEHICFEEAEDLCQKALGDISDYEDDDLRSDVDEMELKTSSSEAEDNLEEEGLEGLEGEDIEGLESSSSGEEGGGGHKKKAKGGKGGKGKGGKGAKGGGGKGGKGGKGDKKGGKGGKGGKAGKGSDDKEGGKKRKKGKGDADDTEDEDGQGKKKKKGENDMGDAGKKGGDNKNADEDGANKGKNKDGENLKNDKDGDKKGSDGKDDNKDGSKGKDDGKTGDKDGNKGGDKSGANKDDKDGDKNKFGKGDEKDKDGNLLRDKDGNPLRDKDGNLLKDKDGNILRDKDGNPLRDKDGNILKDKDGNILKDKDGNPLRDKDGNLLKDKDGNILRDKDGNPLRDKDGNILKDKDGNILKDKDGNPLRDKDGNLLKDKDGNILRDKDGNPLRDKDGNLLRDKDGNLLGDKGGKDGQGGKDTDKNKDGGKDGNKDGRKDGSKDGNKDKDKDRNKNKDKDMDKDFDKNKQGGRGLLDKDGKPIRDGKDKDGRSGQGRTKSHTDGAEADDENEDINILRGAKRLCSGPNPNQYPGYFKCPSDMAVVGSETGSYQSICKLLQAGFKLANRVLTMTPWGNFVVFRCLGQKGSDEKHYFIFDGCTCNFDRFRHLDLSVGTAGLICFKTMHDVVKYIRHIRKIRNEEKKRSVHKETAYEICRQYC